MTNGTGATNLIVTLLILGGGALLLWRARHSAEGHAQEHQRRIEDRLARGTDAYFEELRTLQTYQPLANPWPQRIVGAAAIVFGTIRLFFQFL